MAFYGVIPGFLIERDGYGEERRRDSVSSSAKLEKFMIIVHCGQRLSGSITSLQNGWICPIYSVVEKIMNFIEQCLIDGKPSGSCVGWFSTFRCFV